MLFQSPKRLYVSLFSFLFSLFSLWLKAFCPLVGLLRHFRAELWRSAFTKDDCAPDVYGPARRRRTRRLWSAWRREQLSLRMLAASHHSWQTPAPAENAAPAHLGEHVASTQEGANLPAVASALRAEVALTAEISRGAAHEALKAHLDLHEAVMSRVESLKQLVAPLTPDGSDARTTECLGCRGVPTKFLTVMMWQFVKLVLFVLNVAEEGRVRRSTSSASGIWTKVICD